MQYWLNFNYFEEVDEIFEEQSDFDPDINLPMGIDNKCAYIEIEALETELNNNLNNDFGLLEMNIRSLIKNFTPLQLLIESLQEKLHFILLVETWLNTTSVDHYGLEGFRCEMSYRKRKRGGGTAIYIRDSIMYSKLPKVCYLNYRSPWNYIHQDW